MDAEVVTVGKGDAARRRAGRCRRDATIAVEDQDSAEAGHRGTSPKSTMSRRWVGRLRTSADSQRSATI